MIVKPVVAAVVCVSDSFLQSEQFLDLCAPQMFLLKADQMKRYEKEKVSVELFSGKGHRKASAHCMSASKMCDLQQINRINQAREQGWKHVLSSSGGSSPERKVLVFFSSIIKPYFYHHLKEFPLLALCFSSSVCLTKPPLVLLTQCYVGGGKRSVPSSAPGPAPAAAPAKAPYEHYHAALDQMAKPQPKVVSREGSSAGPSSPSR